MEEQMKKGIILFGIMCFLIFGCSTKDRIQEEEAGLDGVKFQKLTLAEAKELAGQEDKLVMVDFFSPT